MRSRLYLGWLIVLVFGAGSVIGAVAFYQRSQDKFETHEQNTASRAASQTQANLNLSVGQLATEAAFFQASTTVTKSEYEIFTKPLLARTAISGTVFIQRVTHTHRARFERARSMEILDRKRSTTTYRRAATRPVYFPVTLAAVEAGERTPVLGLDVNTDPVQSATLAKARDTGDASITPIRQLLAVGGKGLIVYQPIYNTPAQMRGKAERRRDLVGFAAGLFRDRDIAAVALNATPNDNELQLLEGDIPVIGGPVPLTGGASAPVTVAGRTWTLVVLDPNPPSAAVPLVIGISGLALSAMLGALLYIWSRRERYALAMVARRIAERDAAEAERQRSARQYRLLAENATDVISVQDVAGHFLYVSPSSETVLGWMPDELLRSGALELIHPDDHKTALKNFSRLAEPGSTVTHQFRSRRKDDTFVWVESTAHSLKSEDGTIEIHAATRDIRERKAMEQELERLAHEDPLTELVNRRRFEQELEGELARTRRDGGVGSLLLLDLDRFKEVNDTFGHAAGDAFLIEVATLLRERLREADVIARLGGDEFAVILHGSGEQHGRLTGEAIARAIREHSFESADGGHTTASIGIALFDDDPRVSPATLMAEADIAMYAAKRDGRDRVRVYDVDRDATHEGRATSEEEETRPDRDSD